jgi:hypothetical protein
LTSRKIESMVRLNRTTHCARALLRAAPTNSKRRHENSHVVPAITNARSQRDSDDYRIRRADPAS